jgi:hypothetical protein
VSVATVLAVVCVAVAEGRTEHRGVDARKFWERVVEREDLGWTDKGKITGRKKDERDRFAGRSGHFLETSSHRG